MRRLLTPSQGLLGIAIALALQNSAMNLVTVFVPLLLLQNGAGFAEVCLFYIFYNSVGLLLDWPVARWVRSRGARPALIAGFMFSGLHLVLLRVFTLTHAPTAILGAALALAGANTCVWTAQHLHLARALDLNRRGKDLVLMDTMVRVTNLLAPAAGALMAVLGGDGLLLGAAAALTLLAVVPVWRLDRAQLAHTPESGPQAPERPDAVPLRDMAASAGFAVHNSINVTAWPLYLAVVYQGFAEVGGLSSAAAVVSFLVVMLAGGRLDRGRSSRVLLEGTLLCGAFHAARVFADGPVAIAGVTAGSRAAASYQRIAWGGIYYGHAQRLGFRYVVRLELSDDAGGLLVWLVLLAGWLASGSQHIALVLVFLLGALGALCVLAITKDPAGSRRK
ncbi:hypothetical protein KDA82_25435 [Streptomyces daliensis]|uniref:MFS transporter n=1 Tax=Streptomyces daliensis TaxID=299421 RepID=A0A8T4IYP8_9ACTN|nr:hypothetical protein [Streptomyces daliensis]